VRPGEAVAMSEYPAEILIVDDEPEVCSMLVEALSSPRRRCAAVPSGPEALRLLRERPFDLIVSDIVMPDMTGLELLAQARAVQPHCRTILMTGVSTPTLAKQAIRQGAFDYIEKPFCIEELRKVVDAAVDAPCPPDGINEVARDEGAVGLRDPLTGLPSHRRFVEELARLRTRCRRRGGPVSVLIVDSRQFRLVNERHGHNRGDLLLREVGRRLKRCARDTDMVARYAWDQFALALPDTTEEAARPLAERCCATACEPVDLGSRRIVCTISIGLAECESGFIENETHLLRRASEALAEAKTRGPNTVVAWSELAGRDGQEPRPDLPGIEAMRREFQRLQTQLKQSYLESTRALVAAVEAKDPYTQKHSMTVSHYASSFARHMGLPGAQVEAITTAAILHDVGKIGIPDAILTKPGRLTESEFALVRRHPVMGVQILEHVSFLRAELPIILHHHERYDGRGYPAGLAGERIPLGARILHFADALDAMLSVRSYKGSRPVEYAVNEFRLHAGRQFDPAMARHVSEGGESHPEQIVYPHERDVVLPRVLAAC